MPHSSSSATPDVQVAPPEEATPDEQRASANPKLLPPYAVVLLNDDDHTFEFVVGALRKVFGYKVERCFELTQRVHEQGRGVVWTGPKEVAELKRDLLRSVGPDFTGAKKVEYPLGVLIEPLPQ